jgi:hypothetical protein
MSKTTKHRIQEKEDETTISRRISVEKETPNTTTTIKASRTVSHPQLEARGTAKRGKKRRSEFN